MTMRCRSPICHVSTFHRPRSTSIEAPDLFIRTRPLALLDLLLSWNRRHLPPSRQRHPATSYQSCSSAGHRCRHVRLTRAPPPLMRRMQVCRPSWSPHYLPRGTLRPSPQPHRCFLILGIVARRVLDPFRRWARLPRNGSSDPGRRIRMPITTFLRQMISLASSCWRFKARRISRSLKTVSEHRQRRGCVVVDAAPPVVRMCMV